MVLIKNLTKMKKILRITLFSILVLGASSKVSAQESYGGALNLFPSFGSFSSITGNYEIPLAQNFTISPEATLPFSFDYILAGARVDYYFDSLLGLNEPWDIWAGVGAGLFIALDDAYASGGDIGLILHVGAEYKFNKTWGLILDAGAYGGSLGVGIHL